MIVSNRNLLFQGVIFRWTMLVSGRVCVFIFGVRKFSTPNSAAKEPFIDLLNLQSPRKQLTSWQLIWVFFFIILLVGGFNPLWKILVQMGIFPKFRGQNKKYLKPPPSNWFEVFSFHLFVKNGFFPPKLRGTFQVPKSRIAKNHPFNWSYGGDTFFTIFFN